jgi:hypothetical protein
MRTVAPSVGFADTSPVNGGGKKCVQRTHFTALNSDQRMRHQRRRHSIAKHIPIHSQRAAGWHLRRFSARHHQRAQPPHFFMQQANGIAAPIIAAERI